MVKVDLHTHSYASPDGSLKATDYERMLSTGKLDCIAVTDHNHIAAAQELQQRFGERIIVGEEISTLEGELIGLYLGELVPAGMSALDTAVAIHNQGGLVYVPHPFETVRSGLGQDDLSAIAGHVDIIETCNGRTMQNRGEAALGWAEQHAVPGAASSDAHGPRGWGNTYSELDELPSRAALLTLLRSARHHTGSAGLIGRLYPKLNRLRKLG
jgi:predicted metal-dependent phosphoesterase TrpH